MQNPVLNQPTHPWYEWENHIRIPNIAESKWWLDAYWVGEGDVPVPSEPVLTNVDVNPATGPVGTRFTRVVSFSGYPQPVLTYQWYMDGAPIPGETNGYYDSDTVTSNLQVEVTATNSEGSDVVISDASTVTVAPESPTAGVVTLTGSGEAGTVLTANLSGWGFGIPPGTPVYSWFAGGIGIPGETGGTFTPDASYDGLDIYCRVSVDNGQGSVFANSNSITVYMLTPPSVVTNPTITGTPEVGQTLTLLVGDYDGNPTPTVTVAWLRDGVVIPGETGLAYVVAPADQGTIITARETATNSEGSVQATTNGIAIPLPPDPPVNTVAPVITGTADIGETLSVTAGSYTGASPINLTYQWLRDGVVIPSETGNTYFTVEADADTTISVRETAANVAGSIDTLSNGIDLPPLPTGPVPSFDSTQIHFDSTQYTFDRVS